MRDVMRALDGANAAKMPPRVLSELRSQKSVLDAWDAHLSLMDLRGCLYHCL